MWRRHRRISIIIRRRRRVLMCIDPPHDLTSNHNNNGCCSPPIIMVVILPRRRAAGALMTRSSNVRKKEYRRHPRPRGRYWCGIFYHHASWSRPLYWVFSSLIYYPPSEEPDESRNIDVLTVPAVTTAIVVLVRPFGVLRSKWNRLVIAMVMLW